MFSNRIRISGLLLILSHCSQTFVLLTANVEDVKKIARKFVSEPMAQQIAEFISRAAGHPPAPNVSEENDQNVQAVENMSDNEIKRIQRQGATSKRYRTLTRKVTTWIPKDYDVGTRMAEGVVKDKKQVIKKPPKSNSRQKPQSNSQVFSEKQIKEQLQQQIDKLQYLHSKDSVGDRNVDKLNQKSKRPQRLPNKHRKRKRPGAPSQNYQTTENSYDSDQQGYPSSQQVYRRPQQQYEGPQQQYESPQQQYESPQQQYESPQQEYKSSQQEYRSPQQEYISPQPEYKSSQPEYKSPQQEYKSLQQEYKNPQQEYRSPQQEYRSPQQDYQNLEQGYQSSPNMPQQPGNYQDQNQEYQTVKPDYGSPEKKKPKPYQPDYQSQVQQLEDEDVVKKETTNQNPYTSDQTNNQELDASAIAKSTSGYAEQVDYIETTKHRRLRARPRERYGLQDNDITENQTVNTQPTMIIEFSSRYNGFNIEPKEALTTEKEKAEFDQYDHPQHLVATAGPVGLKAVPEYWQGYPRQSLFVQGVNSAPTVTSPPVISSAANIYPNLT